MGGKFVFYGCDDAAIPLVRDLAPSVVFFIYLADPSMISSGPTGDPGLLHYLSRALMSSLCGNLLNNVSRLRLNGPWEPGGLWTRGNHQSAVNYRQLLTSSGSLVRTMQDSERMIGERFVCFGNIQRKANGCCVLRFRCFKMCCILVVLFCVTKSSCQRAALHPNHCVKITGRPGELLV